MSIWHWIRESAELAALPCDGAVAPLSPDAFAQQSPDGHWVLLEDGAIAARCSLWWTQTPTLPDQQLGVIGHYAATETAGAGLLQKATETLHEQGCTFAIGPMDGNTWRRYRLVSGSPPSEVGEWPPFFLEPQNPLVWNQSFQDAGFTPFATYSSALNADLNQRDPRMARVGRRLKTAGVKVRSLNLNQFDAELQQIYTLSRESFQQNLLYSPISAPEFLTQYAAIKPYVQPDLVLLAEHGSQLVGFVFAIPDLLQAQRGEAIDTVIVKTVAAQPGRAYAGLGSFLVDQVQAIAQSLGYHRAIHALMYDGNPSRNISQRFAIPIRHYTLYGKTL